jgi:hypothetical protein
MGNLTAGEIGIVEDDHVSRMDRMRRGELGQRLAGEGRAGDHPATVIDQRHAKIVLLADDDRHRGALDGRVHLIDQGLEGVGNDVDGD